MRRFTAGRAPLGAAGLIAALTVASGAALAAPFADLAPRDSAFVAGTDDFSSMWAAFKRTPLHEIWQDPAVREWLEGPIDEVSDELDDFMEQIGAEMEDLSPPTGSAGIAVRAFMPGEGENVPPLHIFAAGEFGENAADVHATIVKALEEGENEGEFEIERDEFGGAEIFVLTMLEEDDEGEDDADEWDQEWEDDWGDDWDDGAAPDFENLYYARSGETLLLATSMRDVENAIERAAGKDVAGASANPDFAAAMAQLGPSQGYAVLLNGPLYELTEKVDAANAAGGDPMMAGPPVMALLDAFGLSDVRAAGSGFTMDADSGIMETTYGVLLPRKRGLFELVEAPDARFTPPAWVSADVASVTMLQLNLADTLGVLNRSVNSLPAEFAQQAGFMLQMAQGFAAPIFANLGTEIYIVQSFTKPFSVDSQKQLVAIGVKDEIALTGVLGAQFTQFGMESRDFQGSQIWSLPAGGGGMLPMGGGLDSLAIGIGAGFMFVGTETDVEGALRLAAQKEAPSLADDARFRRAAGAMRPSGLAFNFTDTRTTAEYSFWMLKNMDKIAEQQMEAMLEEVEDPELRAMIRENQGGDTMMPDWIKQAPDLSRFIDLFGDSVTEVHLTDDGIRGRSVWLRPAE